MSAIRLLKWPLAFVALALLSVLLASSAPARDANDAPFIAPSVTLAQYPAAKPIKRGGVFVSLHCGLFSGNVCALQNLAAKMQRRGWVTQVSTHWSDPAIVAAPARAAGARIFLVGHSAGADRVIARGKAAGARKVFSVDATVANGGAPSGLDYLNFYNPANRALFGICCGGARVSGDRAGSRNVIVRIGHIPMAGDARVHARIISEIAALSGRKR